MILQENNIHRKSGAAILISDKIDFKMRKDNKGNEKKNGYFIMIKGTQHQEYMTLLNIYICPIRKY